MKDSIRREYHRLRRKVWKPLAALDAAQATWLFEQFENQGLVRFEVIHDEYACAEDVICQCGEDDCEERHQKPEIERANRYGVFGIIVYAFQEHVLYSGEKRLDHVESCWGFIDDDWQDSGYDTDFKRATIDEAFLNVTAGV